MPVIIENVIEIIKLAKNIHIKGKINDFLYDEVFDFKKNFIIKINFMIIFFSL